MKLEGKVAVITGAGSGIGQAIARLLAGEGASVVLVVRQGAEKAAEDIRKTGAKVLPIVADISHQDQVNDMVKKTLAEFGGVHILVNNAVYPSQQRLFHETEVADWEPHINVTLKGTLYCCRAAIPHMIEQRWGRIINITSDAGRTGMPRQALYSACKAAIAGFSRSISKELASHGIVVNCVSPSAINTPTLGRVVPPGQLEKIAASNPSHRVGEPEDVANLVLFLASDDSGYIVGQQISINGGALSF